MLKKKFVVQIRECLPNKKYHNSVTNFVGSKEAKKIYEILEDKKKK